ncbi:MAG: GNAT family N-acetyltransferase [Aeromicrobium sp.]
MLLTPIETERLLLRPYENSDASRVLDILSRLEVIRWLGNPPYVPMETLDEALAWIQRWRDRHNADHFQRAYAIEVRETGIVAGTVLVARAHRIEGGFVNEYEVGWHLHPDSVGHGYATEAAAAVLDATFVDGLEDIYAGMFPDNEPSASVARRLRLREIGVQEDPWYGGDGRLFHTTRDQWEARFEQDAATP